MDKYIIHWICEFVTSLGFPNLAFKIAFALTYTSVLKGRPSTRALTFGITNSFKHENFPTVVMSARSIFSFQIDSRILTNLNFQIYYRSTLGVLPSLDFLLHFSHCSSQPSSIRPAWLQILLLLTFFPHYTFTIGILLQADLLPIFFLNFFFVSVLLFCFKDLLLEHHIPKLRLHVYLSIFQFLPYFFPVLA